MSVESSEPIIETAPPIESILEVGLPILLTTGNGNAAGERGRAVVVGWRQDECLVLDLIFAERRTLTFNPTKLVALRFLHEGYAYGFRAHVLDRSADPTNPTVHVSWPQELSRTHLRKYSRAVVKVPCSVVLDEGTSVDATLVDVSQGGIRIEAAACIESDSTVHCTFVLPDGTALHQAACIVRNSKANDSGATVGCEFSGLTKEQSEDLEFFMSHGLTCLETEQRDLEIVLLITNDRGDAGLLGEGLGEGFELVGAAGLVDGIAKISALQPSVVLAAGDCAGLVRQVLRASPMYAKTPVIAYGPDPGGSPDPNLDRQLAGLNDAAVLQKALREIAPVQES